MAVQPSGVPRYARSTAYDASSHMALSTGAWSAMSLARRVSSFDGLIPSSPATLTLALSSTTRSNRPPVESANAPLARARRFAAVVRRTSPVVLSTSAPPATSCAFPAMVVRSRADDHVGIDARHTRVVEAMRDRNDRRTRRREHASLAQRLAAALKLDDATTATDRGGLEHALDAIAPRNNHKARMRRIWCDAVRPAGDNVAHRSDRRPRARSSARHDCGQAHIEARA